MLGARPVPIRRRQRARIRRETPIRWPTAGEIRYIPGQAITSPNPTPYFTGTIQNRYFTHFFRPRRFSQVGKLRGDEARGSLVPDLGEVVQNLRVEQGFQHLVAVDELILVVPAERARLVRHPRDEVHERVEVVILEELPRQSQKREGSHRREERTLAPQLPVASLAAAVGDDLVVRILIEATQRVFSRNLDAVPSGGGANLTQQTLGPAAAEERVLDVPHLRAREVQPRAVFAADLDDGLVPVAFRDVIAASRVEIPGGELRGVRPRVVPPVHPRALDRDRRAIPALLLKHRPRAPEHAIAVLHELAAVPR
mmetsp:Transcript_13513/g.57182  ORF Transcript_13513/g.57182 Transcript_13513/m.57182 type:complete len:312 (-) Transcript_13513:2443-3378(-)